MLRPMEARATAIVLGAGAGTRLGDGPPKAFREGDGEATLDRTGRAAAASASVAATAVTVPPGSARAGAAPLDGPRGGIPLPVSAVAGGSPRQASVRAALAWVPSTSAIVVVHDAARGAVAPGLFDRVVEAVAAGADGA